MKVLQVHTRYRQRGGEDAVVEGDTALLRSAGHEVHQFHLDNPAGGVPAAAGLLGSIWNPVVARRFDEILGRFAPDVVHVHNTWFACSPAPLQVARRQGVPIVMTVHNFRLACANGLFLRDGAPCEKCLTGSSFNAVRHACYRGSRMLSGVAAVGIAAHRRNATWLTLVSRFVVLSEFAGEKLATLGVPASQVVVGSNFVNDPGTRLSPPSSSDEVLFVGRVSREKGVAELLAAWRSGAPRGLRLTVVGDGPERASLEAESTDGVRFTGQVPRNEVRRRIADARAVVIPSVWFEGQPVVALEAAASGTPLVMSRIGGLPEILGNRDAGWLSAPGDSVDLARALRGLQDAGEVDRRGGEARLRYDEAFTEAGALTRLENVYGEVVAA